MQSMPMSEMYLVVLFVFIHFGKFLSYIVISYLVDFLDKLILLYFM